MLKLYVYLAPACIQIHFIDDFIFGVFVIYSPFDKVK